MNEELMCYSYLTIISWFSGLNMEIKNLLISLNKNKISASVNEGTNK